MRLTCFFSINPMYNTSSDSWLTQIFNLSIFTCYPLIIKKTVVKRPPPKPTRQSKRTNPQRFQPPNFAGSSEMSSRMRAFSKKTQLASVVEKNWQVETHLFGCFQKLRGKPPKWMVYI